MASPETDNAPDDLGTLVRSFRKADFPDHESMESTIETALADAWTRLCDIAGLPTGSDGERPAVDIDMKRGKASLVHTVPHGDELAVRVVLKLSLWRRFDMVMLRVTGGKRASMSDPMTGKRTMSSRNASTATLGHRIRELVEEIRERLDQVTG